VERDSSFLLPIRSISTALRTHTDGQYHRRRWIPKNSIDRRPALGDFRSRRRYHHPRTSFSQPYYLGTAATYLPLTNDAEAALDSAAAVGVSIFDSVGDDDDPTNRPTTLNRCCRHRTLLTLSPLFVTKLVQSSRAADFNSIVPNLAMIVIIKRTACVVVENKSGITRDSRADHSGNPLC
jgi:hypothetical protein